MTDIHTFLRNALPVACLNGRTLWIEGQWRSASSGGQFKTSNPADGTELCSLARGDETDVDLAVCAANEAFPLWSCLDGQKRATVLRDIARLIRANGDTLAKLDTIDSGRPISQTRGAAIEGTAALFDYYAGCTDKIFGSVVPMGGASTAMVEREPFGVVGAVSPWNYPLSNAVTKLAPILACGNTLVLKPAEQTSLSVLLLAEIMHRAGLPAGVVNIVTGYGAEAGSALVRHPGVRLISFTGSSSTGRRVAAEAGEQLKPVVLELGGKSPLVVFADADLKAAADAAVYTTFMNTGQTCTSCNRVLVEKSVRRRFVEYCVESAQKLRVGDPLSEETQIGPVVSSQQQKRINALVSDVPHINLEIPGYVPTDGGCFVKPMIVDNFDPESEFAKVEIFGPVMSISEFGSDAEAWTAANNSEYGLAASVWTTSLAKAESARRNIQSGIVWINCVHTLNPGTPVCGHKNSGIGVEYGQEAIQQYTTVKTTVTMWGAWQSPFV